MSAEIKKAYRESFPAMRLIGKRYSGEENTPAKWGEWFQNGWFGALEALPQLEGHDDGYIGAMRIVNGELEYWIGMFFPAGTAVPEGYEHIDIEAMDFAVFWRYGKEDGEGMYGLEAHNRCLELFAEHGWERREDDWCFERYNCPRFTEPDEAGNVILDYGISIL